MFLLKALGQLIWGTSLYVVILMELSSSGHESFKHFVETGVPDNPMSLANTKRQYLYYIDQVDLIYHQVLKYIGNILYTALINIHKTRTVYCNIF